MGGTKYVVEQGDCMSSISAQYGFDWRTLWNHPENADLKSSRKDANILYPGDIVFIPDKAERQESCATDQRHPFVRTGQPETLRIRIYDEFGKPAKNTQYELVIHGVNNRKGTTSGDGELRLSIPPTATEARLFLGEHRREISLYLGGLDPLTETSGIQARLANLGYTPGPIDGLMGPRTRQAIRDFQDQYALTVSGQPDDATRAKLKEIHGR